MGQPPTKDRVACFGVSNHGTCSFCKKLETMDHIFFECATTKPIWKGVPNWVGYRRDPRKWDEEIIWLIQETKKKGWRGQILKMVVAETIYTIWMTINDI